jgi:TatD family-associated radical SAM protein
MNVVYEVNDGLYVNLTNRCPCSCAFCIRNNGDGVYGSDSLWLEREPEADEVVEAVEKAGPRRFRELVFCGYGEPTERLDTLLAVARHVRKEHPEMTVRVNTNGLADLIAGEPVAARFAGLVDVVSVSLNAATKEEYAALCRPKFGDAAYEAMLDFAKEVSGYVPKVVMTIVATPETGQEKIEACRSVCDALGLEFRVRQYTS